MPARPQGVYQDKRGNWYFEATIGSDPLTGKRDQITKRGYCTMAEAARERREVLAKIDRGQLAHSPAGLKLNELLDLYLPLPGQDDLRVMSLTRRLPRYGRM
jgi:hypothetical protein